MSSSLAINYLTIMIHFMYTCDFRHDKTDAFALGCVLYELLMCDTLENSSRNETLAQCIDRIGLEAAMNLPHIKIPWLSSAGNPSCVGYTDWLKQLVMSLLRPVVEDRFIPSQLVGPLRTEQSPLLQPCVVASQPRTPGASVTIDNVQLGMLVQRGRHWDDGDDDGGPGCIGVVTKLDHDALFTWVTFPLTLDAVCCRIGSSSKFELQVAPLVSDFVTGSDGHRQDGIVLIPEPLAPGHMMNHNCMVVGSDKACGISFAAPMQRILLPSLPLPEIWRTDNNEFAHPVEDLGNPDSWDLNLGVLANVTQEEWDFVLSLFYGDNQPGSQLSETSQPVDKVQRVQDSWQWESYVRRRGYIALENWGVRNELRAFLVNDKKLTADNISAFQSTGKEFSTNAFIIHDRFNCTAANSPSQLQMVLCRTVVGRVHEVRRNGFQQNESLPELKCHSRLISYNLFTCQGSCLIYPEYIITYRDKSDRSNARMSSRMNAQHADNSNSNRSPTKLCIICMENPVKFAMIVSTVHYFVLVRSINSPNHLPYPSLSHVDIYACAKHVIHLLC